MKISYTEGFRGTRTVELDEYLKPRDTGSTQGSIEQLESELDVCKKTIGKLLAYMVVHGDMTIDYAEEICGIHSSYREYRYPNRTLIA